MALNPFRRRMYEESEKVYQQITSGQLRGADNVEAALMDAHLKASTENENKDK